MGSAGIKCFIKPGGVLAGSVSSKAHAGILDGVERDRTGQPLVMGLVAPSPCPSKGEWKEKVHPNVPDRITATEIEESYALKARDWDTFR
ncbi:hypothetical protein PoB_006515600 [Plakobranchus ocellatus]|uniref:Uncharacterized protein n=1 Tax=Plakobranchus ocellatus TaxID=259542 RepID=A0AAV4D387_9GAST|nr:hypothetical protein PoB_006515600 [Plakobranchus ocellatus]